MQKESTVEMDDNLNRDPCDNVESECSQYPIIDEKVISLNKDYITKMCGNSKTGIGIALSNGTCEIYSHHESSLAKVCIFSGHKCPISEVRFSPQNLSLFYSGSLDGTIKLWDIRAGETNVATFEENPNTKLFTKPMNAFDISCDDKVLCGGSEMVQDDAFMLFWDIRKTTLLGAYWNSHTDDITQVEFHKQKPNTLLTGGMDGLINIFDIIEHKEDDALLYSLNTECSVDKLSWISEDSVSCITHNVEIQVWNVDTADQEVQFSREIIAKAMKKISTDDCYVIDIFTNSNNQTNILAGSYTNVGNCLRTLQISAKGLEPVSDLKENKQIVRCSWYDSLNNVLLTGGESGILSLWKTNSDIKTNLPKKKSKITSEMAKLKIHKNKPYMKK